MAEPPLLADVLRRLYGRIPLGVRLGLLPMREACARFGNPERSFAAVHIAGTNGKGSTAAMVESIARAHGIRTGLYTSPHLCRFAERIRIEGEPVDDVRLSACLSAALDDPALLSFFEATTLAAFLAFRDTRIELGIVEVGLGGRLDATNVLPVPRAAAITGIALDHTDRLGATVEAIAREKAGIAKPGLDIVLGVATGNVRNAIDAVAKAKGATTTAAVDAYPHAIGALGLAGDHQRDNARVAAALGVRIGASQEAIATGLAAVRWPGRLERIGRYCVDAAHNPDGALSLARFVRSLDVPPTQTTLVFGSLADKDWRPMLEVLAPIATKRIYVAVESPGRPGADPLAMSDAFPGRSVGAIDEALRSAEGELVVIAGSILLAGSARAELLALPRDPPVAL